MENLQPPYRLSLGTASVVVKGRQRALWRSHPRGNGGVRAGAPRAWPEGRERGGAEAGGQRQEGSAECGGEIAHRGSL